MLWRATRPNSSTFYLHYLAIITTSMLLDKVPNLFEHYQRSEERAHLIQFQKILTLAYIIGSLLIILILGSFYALEETVQVIEISEKGKSPTYEQYLAGLKIDSKLRCPCERYDVTFGSLLNHTFVLEEYLQLDAACIAADLPGIFCNLFLLFY
jgi:hypothetical protein